MSESPALPSFTEATSWKSIGATWKQLYGGFGKIGLSFEWHEFEVRRPFDWGSTFHPESIELCLNLEGEASLRCAGSRGNLLPMTAAFYAPGRNGLDGERRPCGPHRFITVEFSRMFLQKHLPAPRTGLHDLTRNFLDGAEEPGISRVERLSPAQREIIGSLRSPPVFRGAQVPWYSAKALELAALFFFQPVEEELFCQRQQIIARERVEKVCQIVRENLASPPALDEIARKAGCSSFYLSRTFSKEKGMTISQYVRKKRMEKAAELLRSGKFNVTEAALEVGYSSLSHFSQTFHETFGCCAGLYPLKLPIGGARLRRETNQTNPSPDVI
ncbi:MAG TPA: AraC family transcriptional regulator [Verrucomicrobiae bacterium]|nr:AraC family transcriptional regulator [Verrucomicrobiae bacterium]